MEDLEIFNSPNDLSLLDIGWHSGQPGKMWYEIIPSFGLVFGFLCAPTYLAWVGNKLFRNGKSQARDWEADQRDFMLYLRDQRLTGSEYIPRGLESIPDEPNQ